ncbi:hypothetical protein BKA81DRAFT_66649 [Phyllosticta paracitricarpa]
MVRTTRAAARRQEREESAGADNASEADEPSTQLWVEASQERTLQTKKTPVDYLNSVLPSRPITRDGATRSTRSARPLPTRQERLLRRSHSRTGESTDSSHRPTRRIHKVRRVEHEGPASDEGRNESEKEHLGADENSQMVESRQDFDKNHESNDSEEGEQNGEQDQNEEGEENDNEGQKREEREAEGEEDENEDDDDDDQDEIEEENNGNQASRGREKVQEREEDSEKEEEDRQSEESSESEASIADNDELLNDENGLFGLKQKFHGILNRQAGMREIKKCVKENGLEIESQTARAIESRCAELQKSIREHHAALNGHDDGDSREFSSKTDVAEATRKHTSQITNVLDKLEVDHPERFLMQDLYAFIFPALVRSLYVTVDLFVIFFGRADGSMPAPYANHIANFAAAIVKLGDRVRKSNRSPAMHLKLKKPVSNHLIAPLRAWHKELLGALQRSAAKEQREADRQDDQRRDELAAQRRAEQQRRLAEQQPRREDWRRLHVLRMKVEPDPRCWKHLRHVELPKHKDDEADRAMDNVDSNGETFDRVDAFQHRRGAASHHQNGGVAKQQQVAQEIVGPDWTNDEGLVLMHALDVYGQRNFANPRYEVYARIIQEHCRLGGALRRFSVLEITEKARYFKCMLAGVDWADRIPTF